VSRTVLRTATVLGAWALSASQARAAPGDATRLEYARDRQAVGCPDRAALSAAVSKRLGYDPFFHAARQTIVVEILALEDGLRAQMRLVDDYGMIVGSRELHEQADHCDELVASLALAISIALDPSAALGEAPPRAKPADSAEPAAAEAQPEPATESVAQQHPNHPGQTRDESTQSSLVDRERLQLAARASFFSALGSAPALAFGYRLGLDLQRDKLRLAAEFSQQFSASKAIETGGRARASLLAGTLAPCLASDTLGGCGLLTLGALQTNGEGIPLPASQSTFYAALGARFEYTPTLFGKLELLLQFDALKPLTPVSLRVAGAEVWHTPIFTFAAGYGFRFRFR